MSDLAEKLADLIPSVYYDVIARVLPGAATIAGLMWVASYTRADLKTATGLGDSGVLLAVIGLAYVAGVLLTSLSGIIFGGTARLLTKLIPALRPYGLDRIWSRIDAIDKRDPRRGATLAKMAAEAVLCQNLLVGTVVIFALGCKEIPTLSIVLVTVLLICSVIMRIAVLVGRIASFEKQ